MFVPIQLNRHLRIICGRPPIVGMGVIGNNRKGQQRKNQMEEKKVFFHSIVNQKAGSQDVSSPLLFHCG